MTNYSKDNWEERYQNWKASKNGAKKTIEERPLLEPIKKEKVELNPLKKKEERSLFPIIFSYLFVIILAILTLNQFFGWRLVQEWSWQIIFLAILTGSGTFLTIKKKMRNEPALDKRQEELEEKTKKTEFAFKFPIINKIPVFGYTIKWMYKEGLLHSTLLILVLLGFLFFGTYHLGQFMSVDEPKWVNVRVPQLYDSITNGTLESTYINDKPGILPAFLSGFVNFFLDYNSYKSNPLSYEWYLTYWRLPIILFNLLLLIPIYFLTKKLTNKNVAILTTIFIGLNPIIIGISQIVNLDATLWSTVFISFLAFVFDIFIFILAHFFI